MTEGSEFREYRQCRCLTQHRVGEMLGIRSSQVSAFETDRPLPWRSQKKLMRLLRRWRDSEGRLTTEGEGRRARQRALAAAVPPSSEFDAYRAAMAERAYDFMCDGDVVAADALADFLPEVEASAMLDRWLEDQA